MLSIAPTAQIYLAAGATDLRKSYDSLAAIVRHHLGKDPLSGGLFAFCNRRRNRLKILLWDRGGFVIVAKRLEQGTFAWPALTDRCGELSPEQLTLLLAGIDVSGLRWRRWYKRAQ